MEPLKTLPNSTYLPHLPDLHGFLKVWLCLDYYGSKKDCRTSVPHIQSSGPKTSIQDPASQNSALVRYLAYVWSRKSCSSDAISHYIATNTVFQEHEVLVCSFLKVYTSFKTAMVDDLGAVVQVFRGVGSAVETLSTPIGRTHQCCRMDFSMWQE